MMQKTEKLQTRDQIVPYLKKSKASKDVNTFGRWEKGEITTQMAIEEFRKHNLIDRDIDPVSFQIFLAGLGWRRPYDGKKVHKTGEGVESQIFKSELSTPTAIQES